MKRLTVAALLLACAGTSPAEPEAPRPGLTGARLAALLPEPPRGWEVLEDPVTVPVDPELRRQGLLASVAHHYTRIRGPVTEVCTVELWSLRDPARAAAVEGALTEEWIRRAGPLLVLARGRRLERHVGTRNGMMPACTGLAESAHQRCSRAR